MASQSVRTVRTMAACIMGAPVRVFPGIGLPDTSFNTWCVPDGQKHIDLGGLCGSQSEVETFVIGRLITSRSRGKTSLSIHLHAGSEAVAVAARAAKSNREPMAADRRDS